jgi:FkbM family methyltransferase
LSPIYCFEPNPISFELLRRNVAGESGIEIHPVAVGPQNSRMELFFGRHSSLQASLVPNEENGESRCLVDVRVLGEVLDERQVPGISLLKIDTEGMEIPILQSLGERLAKIEAVCLEYHSEHDRREIDRRLEDRFVLFASRASLPDRGTVCYAARESIDRWYAQTGRPRFVYPKETASLTATEQGADEASRNRRGNP